MPCFLPLLSIAPIYLTISVHSITFLVYQPFQLEGVMAVSMGVKTRSSEKIVCNTPDVAFHICNSNSCHFRLSDMIFPPWLGFVFCFAFYSCHAYHVMSSCAFHFAYVFVSCIRAFSPLSVSQSDTPTCTGAPLLSLFRVRVLNVLGMDRALPSGPGIAPVDHLSSFGSFGARLVLQRLTA